MDDGDPKKPKSSFLKDEYSQLAEIVIDCTKALIKTCEMIKNPFYIPNEVKNIYSAETKGDVIRDRLLKSFSLEKHPPMLQLDRVELLNKLDRIANKTEHAGRQIELAGSFYPQQYVDPLLQIGQIILETVEAVANASIILFDSFSEASEKVKNVEDLRDRSRDLMFELQTKALQDPESNFQSLFAVEKISSRVQQVAERAKEAADLIELMKLKYL